MEQGQDIVWSDIQHYTEFLRHLRLKHFLLLCEKEENGSMQVSALKVLQNTRNPFRVWKLLGVIATANRKTKYLLNYFH